MSFPTYAERIAPYLQGPSKSPAAPRPPRPRHPHVQRFINMALPGAVDASRRHGVPVSVILAQSALESYWGQAVVGNAYFGVKGSGGTAGGETFTTTEVVNGKKVKIKAQFRAFKNYAEAAEDYAAMLRRMPKYERAFKHTRDPIRFVEEIGAAGYATDPDYAAKLKATIRSSRLTEYDLK